MTISQDNLRHCLVLNSSFVLLKFVSIMAHVSQRLLFVGAGVIGLFISWKAFSADRKDPPIKANEKVDALSPSLSVSPLDVFMSWMSEYESMANSKIPSKFAALSTIKVDASGNVMPSSRMIAVLDITDEFSFIFGTILTSNKVQEMKKNPNVCLTFNYNEPRTSIRVNGIVKQCDAKISEKYWKSRGKSYKIWSMTTTQKNEIDNIGEFEKRMNETAAKFQNVNRGDITLPVDKWSAFEIIPTEVDFWRYGARNLHLRHRYSKQNDTWTCKMLDS